MPNQRTPFSRRRGYQPEAKPITVREDAPDDLRFAALAIAQELECSPGMLRTVACRVLRTRPDPNNWSQYPNIWAEVQRLLEDCPWYKVYDVAEAIHGELAQRGLEVAQEYEDRLNDLFVERGIGWEMREGEVLARGSEMFSATTGDAVDVLSDHERGTAARELHEAHQDLSRRPEPDVTGAIQHAMAAVECVARDVAGQQNMTLGDVLKRHAPSLGIPPPLDQALHKLWGYTSQQGRHLTEGRNPNFEEAELVVGIAAAVCLYLTKKAGETGE